MRLNRFLTEERTLYETDDLFNDIKKKCKPYLGLLKGKEPLFRGLHDLAGTRTTTTDIGFGIKKVHKNRKPKGTPEKEFKLLNKWLEGNEHCRRDKSISVTADEITADFFGHNSWVFPIGKFDYSWVKSPDMNHANKNTGYFVNKWSLTDPEKQATISEFLFAYYSGTLDVRTKQANLSHFITTNKGFDEAYRKGYEIWIDCKEYYYVLVKSRAGPPFKWKELKNMI